MVDFSNQDIDSIVRTVAAEGGNQSPLGQQAIAHVILNRANSKGQSASDIVNAPGQFEGVNNGSASKVAPESALYRKVFNNIAPTLAGKTNDPTNGATLFYSPKAQTALGRESPAWANGQPSAQIGDHNFYTENSPPASSNKLPSPDELIAKHGLPGGNSSAEPSIDDLIARHGMPASVSPSANSGQTPQSPGYQSALTDYQAQQQKAAAAKASIPTAYTPSSPQVDVGSQAMHGFLLNALPKYAGALNALHAGISNALTYAGVGHGVNYSMPEAYTAARDVTQQGLNQTAQEHPIVSGLAQGSGMMLNPASRIIPGAIAKGALQGAGTVAKAVPQVAGIISKVAPTVSSALGTGALSGLMEANNATNQNDPHALEHVGTAALVGMPFGPLAEGASRLGAGLVNPILKKLAPTVGGAFVGGGVPAAATLVAGGSLPQAASAFAAGAPFGAFGGKTVGDNLAANPSAKSIANTKAQAMQTIADTVANGNHQQVAEHLANAAPHATTTLEALGQHSDTLSKQATASNVTHLEPVKTQVAQRQTPNAVQSRIVNGVKEVTGSELSNAGNQTATDIGNENYQNAQDRQNLGTTSNQNVEQATGVNPGIARSNFEDYVENKKNTVDKPLWDAIPTGQAATDEKLHGLLQYPQVRQALSNATWHIGPEAQTENPDFVENPKFDPSSVKTGQNLSMQQLRDMLASGQNFKATDGSTLSGEAQPKPEQMEQVPTLGTWIKAQQDLASQVARNRYGATLSNAESNTYNKQTEQLAKHLNGVLKEVSPELAVAKASSGDTLSGIDEKSNGYKLGTRGENAEDGPAFNRRYNAADKNGEDILTASDKTATQHGYMQRYYEQLQHNPLAAANEYSKPIHQSYQETMFGKEGAAKFQDELGRIKTLHKEQEGHGPIANTASQADKLISTGVGKRNTGDFDRSYDATPDHLKPVYEDRYLNKVRTLTEKLGQHNNITPDHLSDLENLVSSPYEEHIQNRLWGEEKADQFRQAVQHEINSAKSASDITNAKHQSKPEGAKVDALTALTYGGMTKGMHGLGHAADAVATANVANHAIGVIKQGRVTPEVQKAMGEILAQHPSETSKQFKDAHTAKQNVKLSESSIRPKIASSLKAIAASRVANTVNALSGLNNDDQ